MKKIVPWLLLSIALCGCVSVPIPDNYSGTIATVRDSAASETANRAQFYYLSEIDGRRIANVLGETRGANAGKGFSLTTVPFSRNIPARTAKLKLQATIDYGAPIQAMLNSSTLYTAESVIEFTPESNKTYVVNGTLTADRKEVWLEDAATGRRVK